MDGPYHQAIDWNAAGKPDYLFGTGATRTERIFVWIAGLGTGALTLILNYSLDLNWSILQIIVAIGIAFDVGGGVVANSLSSCKRTYHSPISPDAGIQERLLKNHLFFAILHIHPLLVGLIFPDVSWQVSLAWYAGVILAAVLVQASKLYMKRPVAIAMCFISIIVTIYWLPLGLGWEWLGPALFLKIVYGHLVPEEPYRP